MKKREPNGKPKREKQQHEPSPAEVKRLRLAALMGLRDAVWSSVLGYLYMSTKINEEQFHAGDRWIMLARRYHRVMKGPGEPRTAALLRVRASNSRMMESFSEQLSDETARKGYEDALVAVRSGARGPLRLQAIMRVCEHDLMPTGQEQLDDLKGAFDTLRNAWFRR